MRQDHHHARQIHGHSDLFFSSLKGHSLSTPCMDCLLILKSGRPNHRCRTSWQQQRLSTPRSPANREAEFDGAGHGLLGQNSEFSKRNSEALPQQGRPYKVFPSRHMKNKRHVGTSITPREGPSRASPASPSGRIAVAGPPKETPSPVRMHFFFVDQMGMSKLQIDTLHDFDDNDTRYIPGGHHQPGAAYITKTKVTVSRPSTSRETKDTQTNSLDMAHYRPKSGTSVVFRCSQ